MKSVPSIGGALLQAGAGLTLLLALLFTSDDTGFRESIVIALVVVAAYGFFKVGRRKSVVRWWKAWVANFVGVLVISPLAVLGGAPAEAVGEMLGMITIPGAIAAAALVPISKAVHNRHQTPARARAARTDVEQNKLAEDGAFLEQAMDEFAANGVVEGLTLNRAELLLGALQGIHGIPSAITTSYKDASSNAADRYKVVRLASDPDRKVGA